MQTDISNQLRKGSPCTGTISINELPGPPGFPLLGNFLQITPRKFHRIMENWSDRYGTIFKIRLGNIPIVIITAPQTIQYILKSRPEKFRRLRKMDDVIREMGIYGVFNAEGEDWKRQRKLFSQALNLNHLKIFFPVLINTTEKLLKRWNMLASQGSPVAIKNDMMRYTVDVTSRLAFGYNMNTIEKDNDIIQNHLEIIFPAIFKRINSPVPYWKWIKLPADRELEKSLASINSTMQGIIDETRQQMIEEPVLFNQPSNFLQALLAAAVQDETISNQMIIGNILTMLLAGEDTTAHTIAWIFHFMSLYPDVQQKMQREADHVLGDERSSTRFENMARLQYIEAVALEAMRLKPVAPMLFLDTLEDVVLENVNVPKDTGVFLQMHRAALKEDNFSYPEKFIPERWLEGGCPAHKAHNQQAFVPFGGGPRFCPGYNLAMLELKAVLSMVAQNFIVIIDTDPKDVHERMAFTMMPSDFFVKLVKKTIRQSVYIKFPRLTAVL